LDSFDEADIQRSRYTINNTCTHHPYRFENHII